MSFLEYITSDKASVGELICFYISLVGLVVLTLFAVSFYLPGDWVFLLIGIYLILAMSVPYMKWRRSVADQVLDTMDGTSERRR
jgi:uncharacterized protein (DUF983 family)